MREPLTLLTQMASQLAGRKQEAQPGQPIFTSQPYDNSGIIEQLIEVYYKYEDWHRWKLSHKEAFKYFKQLINSGNVVYEQSDGVLLGYFEFWRLTFEQFGWYICERHIDAMKEDVTMGNICYLANIWIDPNHRRGEVVKALRYKFFKANMNCAYFVGDALRKKTQPIKVFKRPEFINKYVKEREG